jgi:hypothetical protein
MRPAREENRLLQKAWQQKGWNELLLSSGAPG